MLVPASLRRAVLGAALGIAALLPPARAAVPPPPGFADLVAAVEPALVRIETLENAAARPPELAGTPPRRGGLGGGGGGGAVPPGVRAPHRAMGAGSGFLVDADGVIVTNHHVAGEARSITVTLADGTELPARLLGTDPVTDIAVLKVDLPPGGAPPTVLRFADAAPPRVGDWALVMGNPFGLGASVSIGIVSARGRDLGGPGWGDLIQTDAAINPGNSGGPMFNAQGQVIGVTTSIVTPSGGSVGLGFAVPAGIAARVVEALRRDGRVERGWLGVEAQPMTRELARGMGGAPPRGALLDNLAPNGPAARAGLRPGDVVTALDEQPTESPVALARAVGLLAPGSEARLRLWRAGQELHLPVVLGTAPARTAATPPPAAPDAAPEHRGYGLLFTPPPRPGSRAPARPAGAAADGAVVGRVLPGGAAEAAGLRPGDIILGVGGAAVRSAEEAIAALTAAARANAGAGPRDAWVTLRVRRGDDAVFVAMATPQ